MTMLSGIVPSLASSNLGSFDPTKTYPGAKLLVHLLIFYDKMKKLLA
jgi:hypothetical protein